MLDISNYRVEAAHNPIPSIGMSDNAIVTEGKYADAKSQERFDRVREWFQQSINAQYQNRLEMAKDQQYYDGEQWSEEDKQLLAERGQAAFVYNKIKPTIDWILGTERKSRVDTLVLARNKDKTTSAEYKTKLMKYINDINMTAYHRSSAFAESAISGLGWLEAGISNSADEPLYTKTESWRNIWYDHLHSNIRMDDARYIFRAKWVDLDVAQAMFPDNKYDLEAEAQHVLRMYPFSAEESGIQGAGTYDDITGRATYDNGGPFLDDVFSVHNRRLRVRLIECWYKETAAIKVVQFPNTPIHGTVLKANDLHQQYAIETGEAVVADAVKPVMRVMIYCGKTILHDDVSPYRHNRFPFIPVWCYRNGKDNAPYGIVRNVRDPQDDLNKRMSKALHLMNTSKAIADNNATTNWHEFREELNRPDGVVRVTPGAKVQLIEGSQLAGEQLQVAMQDAQFIQDVSGVTDENMGRNTNVESGVGIRAKQNQGLVATSVVFDNLNIAIQLCGEIQLSLIEQFYDAPKVIRLLNDKNAASFIEINSDGNITDDKADFIVAQQDYRDTIRQSMFEMMSEFTTRLDPNLALNMLDLVVDMSDLPGREAIVQRIRKLNGQTDPEAAVTPEEEQENMVKEQQAQAEMAQQKQFEMKMQELELKEKEIKILMESAKAEKLKADAVVSAVEALYSSMQTAQTAVTIPGVVPVADEIAKSAGFVDKNTAPIYQEPIAQVPQAPITQTNTSPMFPAQPDTAGEGLMTGIETQRNDGVI